MLIFVNFRPRTAIREAIYKTTGASTATTAFNNFFAALLALARPLLKVRAAHFRDGQQDHPGAGGQAQELGGP